MSNHQIDYDQMVQQALLDVVRKLLGETAKHGLPGNHHFYIAFKTDFPGVSIPGHLKAKHPEEMTIVLQNQFWDLEVQENQFSVGLSFNQKLETLVIPFAAVTGFLDPSVEFGLQFQHQTDADETASADTTGTEEEASDPVPDHEAPNGDDATTPEAEDDTPNVVTLDAFRKKK